MKTKWIQYEHSAENPKHRIFCFPYAGGSALFYAKWYTHISSHVDVFPIQLPGRESRMKEKPIRDMNEALERIIRHIEPLLTENYSFVGHSMGSIMAYEVAKRLAQKKCKMPERIYISGALPPDLLGQSEKIHEMSDEDFCNRLMGYDNLQPDMLEHEEFYKFFLPIIRADFEMIETYRPMGYWKMPCDVTILSGTEDPFVPIENLEQWDRYCEKKPDIVTFSGNHFFLKEHVEEVCGIINENMKGPNYVYK